MSERDGSEIAVCGLAGRFPGARDVDALWSNLRAGRESIATFTRQELQAAGEDPWTLDDPAFVAARPILDDVDRFDAAFFGLSPREAEIMDPQHRLFLESAWEAVEAAGCDTERFRGVVSVYAGVSFSNYLVRNLYENRPVMESFGDFETTLQNVPDSLATLVGYKLGLRGACCAVQTFCSSSLVAVHLASQALLSFECDMALAGGVTVYVPQRSGYKYQEGSILSRDGHCRAFAADATGTVFGSGVGVVVLRRLEDALADGAPIRAVIRGSAVNNDGALKASFAAPGGGGQASVVVEALASSGVSPDSIGMIEAHGTGTLLGDPVEVRALTKAFRTKTTRRGYCALGSVKSNVGHLDAAAGVTGLIKAVLSLEHAEIPPTLHAATPNPELGLESSPFYLSTELRAWPASDEPRRAGVSAFGIGGTNAHVILEEAPARETAATASGLQLLPVSARTPGALRAALDRLAAYLEADPKADLAAVAFTLQAGRRGFEHRAFVVAADVADAARGLRAAQGTATERRNPSVSLAVAAEATVGEARRLKAVSACLANAFDLESALAGPVSATPAADLCVTAGPHGLTCGAAGPLHGDAGLLELVGRLWAAGVEMRWEALHGERTPLRVPLPTYPFERERFWVEPIVEAGSRRDPHRFFHREVWKAALPAAAAARRTGPVLVFEDEAGIGAALADTLAATRPVVRVREGAAFAGDPTTGYVLDPAEAGHYAQLFADLARRGPVPADVVHCWGAAPAGAAGWESRLQEAADRGFYSLLHVAQHRPAGPGRISVVASGLFDVLGTEALAPERATVAPLCRVVAQEDPGVECRLIELAPDAGRESAAWVAAELDHADAPVVALRAGRRWVVDYEPLSRPAVATPRPSGGTCLVTGGLGDLGFAFAVFLAGGGNARLVLTGRTPLSGTDEDSLRKRRLRALESFGAQVLYVAADVSDAAAMRGVVSAARERFGAITGVVHAAGALDADTLGPVRTATREACERQFDAKVRGTLVLAEALEGQPLEFGVLTASLSSVLGGLGYAAYAAANAFEDAFAHAQRRKGRPWTSVDFDQWSFGKALAGAARQALRDGQVIRVDEAAVVFERILGSRELPRLVLSTGPLRERLDRWFRPEAAAAAVEAPARSPRPALRSLYEAPRDATERSLVEIWQGLLGVEPIGIRDDFFELGGHSLFAARVLARVRDSFDVALPLDALFDAPRIVDLAGRVTAAAWARPGARGADERKDRVEIEI